MIVTFLNENSAVSAAAARFGADCRVMTLNISEMADGLLGIDIDDFMGCPSCVRACGWLQLIDKSPFLRTLITMPTENIFDVVWAFEATSSDTPLRYFVGARGLEAIVFDRGSNTTKILQLKSMTLRSSGTALSQRCLEIVRECGQDTLQTYAGSAEAERQWKEVFRVSPTLGRGIPVITLAYDYSDVEALVSTWSEINWGERQIFVSLPTEDCCVMLNELDVECAISIHKFETRKELLVLSSLQKAVQKTNSEWIVFVAPHIRPRPGANLFLDLELSAVAYSSAGCRFERYQKSACKRISTFGEPVALVNCKWFIEAFNAFQSRGGGYTERVNFDEFAVSHATSSGMRVVSWNPFEYGWFK